MSHTNAKSAVVGISGGLDSTLALLVTAKAFDMLGRDKKGDYCGYDAVLWGTTDRTYNNACEMTRQTGATLIEVPIGEAVNVHFRDIGHDPDVHDVTYGKCTGKRADSGAYGYCESGSRYGDRNRRYVGACFRVGDI